jgi:hypothetical protein
VGSPGDRAERWFAYRLELDEGQKPLFVAAAPGGNQVTEVHADVESFEWSSDGKKLVYVTREDGGGPNGAYWVDFAQGAPSAPLPVEIEVALEGEDAILNATLSKDAEFIALHLYQGGTSRWFSRTLEGASDAWWPLTEGVAGKDAVAPDSGRFVWSPDRTKLAIIEDANPKDEDSELYVAPVEPLVGSYWLTYNASEIVAWAGDSSAIVSRRIELGEQYLTWFDAATDAFYSPVDVAGSDLDDVDRVSIAPDSSAVLFTATEDDVGALYYDVFVRDIVGGVPDTLTKVDASLPEDHVVSQVAWLPDSARIAYLGNLGGNAVGSHLYVTPAAGGDWTPVSGPLFEEGLVYSFRAAGDSVVFGIALEGEGASTTQLFEVGVSMTPPSAPVAVTPAIAGEFLGPYFLAPDERRLLVLAEVEGGGAPRIYYADRGAVSPALVPLSDSLAGGTILAAEAPWSADSKFASYAADESGEGAFDVFLARVEGEDAPVSSKVTAHAVGTTVIEIEWQP